MNNEVISRIPQRPPFLFVDRIVEEEEKSIVCERLLTGVEDFFKGHFPGNPVMPGVLIQESLFQTAAVLMNKPNSATAGVGVVTGVSKGKFKRMVRPGDTMTLKVEMTEQVANACYFKGRAYVGTELACALEFSCAMVSKEQAEGN
jgi:3-hydroxyacyl-[acyl-carrier-protein] dehydratase